MRRTSFSETTFVKSVSSAAAMLCELAVLILVLISMVETATTLLGVVNDVRHEHEVILFGVMLVVLPPVGGVIFWGCKAILIPLEELIKVTHRYFENRSGPKSALPDGAGPHRQGTRRLGTGLWMGAAFGVALALAIIAVAALGTGPALRITGRWSLLLFWPAYAGGAMARLFGPRFAVLARHGREFGLAYAAAQLVHLGLVAGVVAHSNEPFPQSIMPFFAVGIVWTYLLAFSSLKSIDGVFAPQGWPILRAVGLEYLALVFFTDLVLGPVAAHREFSLEYLPFSMLIILGPWLRVAAALRGFVHQPTPTQQAQS